MAHEGSKLKLFLCVAVVVVFLGVRAPSPPDHVLINGQYWTVHYPPHILIPTILGEMPFAGLTDCEKHRIFISRDEDPADWPDTLQHEAFHAYVCGPNGEPDNLRYNNTDDEHPGIELMTEVVLKFMRDNPKAVEWMQKR